MSELLLSILDRHGDRIEVKRDDDTILIDSDWAWANKNFGIDGVVFELNAEEALRVASALTLAVAGDL